MWVDRLRILNVSLFQVLFRHPGNPSDTGEILSDIQGSCSDIRNFLSHLLLLSWEPMVWGDLGELRHFSIVQVGLICLDVYISWKYSLPKIWRKLDKSEENWILPEAPTYQETKIEIPEILSFIFLLLMWKINLTLPDYGKILVEIDLVWKSKSEIVVDCPDFQNKSDGEILSPRMCISCYAGCILVVQIW